MPFQGVIPPVITPHHEDGTINEPAFAQVLEHLIAEGVHGAIVGGTTGEYYAHSRDERLRLIALGAEIIAGRIPYFVGCGGLRTSESAGYGEAARTAGADGLLVNAPAYSIPSQLELATHVLSVDRAAGLPIMLYNYPGRTGAMMDIDFLDRVGKSTSIRAIKESSGDINRIHLLARDYRHIELFCGMDDQALEFYAWGAVGWVCAGGNCLPQEHLALHRACFEERDFVKGRRIMSALLPLMRILEQGGKFVQSVKYIAASQGLPAGAVREPLRPLRKEQKREIEQALRTLKAEMAQIAAEYEDANYKTANHKNSATADRVTADRVTAGKATAGKATAGKATAGKEQAASLAVGKAADTTPGKAMESGANRQNVGTQKADTQKADTQKADTQKADTGRKQKSQRKESSNGVSLNA